MHNFPFKFLVHVSDSDFSCSGTLFWQIVSKKTVETTCTNVHTCRWSLYTCRLLLKYQLEMFEYCLVKLYNFNSVLQSPSTSLHCHITLSKFTLNVNTPTRIHFVFIKICMHGTCYNTKTKHSSNINYTVPSDINIVLLFKATAYIYLYIIAVLLKIF